MKLSTEQHRVLSAMRCDIEYTPRDLGAKWNTLTALYGKGMVAESATSRLIALFSRNNGKRKFVITDVGVKHTAQASVSVGGGGLSGEQPATVTTTTPIYPTRTVISKADEQNVADAIERASIGGGL